MVNGTVHLISGNKKNGKPMKVFRKSLIYLFPDFEFDVRNNEVDDDANDLVDESYQSSY